MFLCSLDVQRWMNSLVGQLTTIEQEQVCRLLTFDSGVPELKRRAWVLVLMVMMMLKVVMLMLEMVMMMFDTGYNLF